jgi:hypothetical protein
MIEPLRWIDGRASQTIAQGFKRIWRPQREGILPLLHRLSGRNLGPLNHIFISLNECFGATIARFRLG